MISEQKQEALIRILSFTNSLNSFMASEAKKYLSEQSEYSMQVLNGLETNEPQRVKKIVAKDNEPINTSIPVIITTTLNAIDRYPNAAQRVNERLVEAGLSPMGELDFGRYWKNRDEVSAVAERFDDPEGSIYINILSIREKRIPILMKRDHNNTDLIQEWAKLVQL